MSSISNLDRQKMDKISAGLPSKSETIRRLAAEGFQRADIARYLDIRYQHVRNVLMAPPLKRDRGVESHNRPAGSPRPAEREGQSAAACGSGQQWVWTTVGNGGRVSVPAPLLAAIGVGEGDPIQLAVEGDVVRILSRDAVLREVQAYVRRYIPDDVSLVDELLAERRLEAAKESVKADE